MSERAPTCEHYLDTTTDFQILHALWIGLCTKVGNGTLTEDEADILCEKARATLLHKQQEEQQQKTVPPAL